MADPAGATARHVAELTDVALPGLPLTEVDRIEDELLGVRRGEFILAHAQHPAAHPGHELVQRSYPLLEPPALFVDCWTCRVTWEVGR